MISIYDKVIAIKGWFSHLLTEAGWFDQELIDSAGGGIIVSVTEIIVIPFIVLVEQDVAMEISLVNDPTLAWTTDGSNYYTSLGTRNIVDGVRRSLVSVRIGYWELTQAASYNQIVDGSWYEDVANNRLYINPPANYNPANPDPKTQIVLARFKLYFSNYAVEYNGQPYDNRVLLNPEDVSVRIAVQDEMMGSQVATDGSISLANGDGFVDGLLTSCILLGQKIEVAKYQDAQTKQVLKTSMIGSIVRKDSVVQF